jgi:hypothetical protein
MEIWREIDAERIARRQKSFDENLKNSPLFQEVLKSLGTLNKPSITTRVKKVFRKWIGIGSKQLNLKGSCEKKN